MRQKSIGEVLRIARENLDMSLVEAQRQTKIQAKYLQCLEFNDFDSIPDSDYIPSFLSRYAEILDLDAAVLLDAYQKNSLVAFYEDGEEVYQSQLRRGYKPQKKVKNYLPLIYLIMAASFILIFVTYIVYTRVQHQSDITTLSSYVVVSQTSSTTSETSSLSSSATSSSSTSTASSEEKISLTTSGSENQLTATVSGTSGPVDVTLSVTDATSWISVSGTDLASGVVLSPDNKTVTVQLAEGTTTTSIVLGVVEGVDITIAGQKLDTSALTSQSATISVTIQ